MILYKKLFYLKGEYAIKIKHFKRRIRTVYALTARSIACAPFPRLIAAYFASPGLYSAKPFYARPNGVNSPLFLRSFPLPRAFPVIPMRRPRYRYP